MTMIAAFWSITRNQRYFLAVFTVAAIKITCWWYYTYNYILCFGQSRHSMWVIANYCYFNKISTFKTYFEENKIQNHKWINNGMWELHGSRWQCYFVNLLIFIMMYAHWMWIRNKMYSILIESMITSSITTEIADRH